MSLLRKGLLNIIRKNQPAVLLNTTPYARHSLPDLPYDYGALEPAISGQIMELHHSKHHATYINNLNVAEEKLREAHARGDLKTVISLGQVLKFNGGGHINHSIFWQNLAPQSSCGHPEGELEKTIIRDFGSVEDLKSQLSALALGIQGSGWAWLGYNKKTRNLQLAACANQDPLEATTGLVPLFGIDIWEHAYYLQYKNQRPEYVRNIWEVANWKDVSERFAKAKS